MEFYQHMESIENLKESRNTKEILMYTLESFEKFKNEKEKQEVKLMKLHNLLLEIKDASNGEFIFTEDNLQVELLNILKKTDWLSEYCDLEEIRFLHLAEVKEALRYPEEEPVILKKVVEAMELINNIHQTDIEEEIRILEDSERIFCGIDFIRDDMLAHLKKIILDNEINNFEAFKKCILGEDRSSLKDFKIDIKKSSLDVKKELNNKQKEYNNETSLENQEVKKVEERLHKKDKEKKNAGAKKYSALDCTKDQEICWNIAELAHLESELELEIIGLNLIYAIKQFELDKAMFANEYLIGNIELETFSNLMDDYNRQILQTRHVTRDGILEFQKIVCFDEIVKLNAQKCYGKITRQQHKTNLKQSREKLERIREVAQDRSRGHSYGHNEGKDVHKLLKSS